MRSVSDDQNRQWSSESLPPPLSLPTRFKRKRTDLDCITLQMSRNQKLAKLSRCSKNLHCLHTLDDDQSTVDISFPSTFPGLRHDYQVSHSVCNGRAPLIRRSHFRKCVYRINVSARVVFSEKEKLHVVITFREINFSNFLTLLRLSTDRVDNPGGV